MKNMGLFFLFLTTSLFSGYTQVYSVEPVKRITTRVFNIEDYGAVGDGKMLNTEAINKAITACSESGGGTVFVPAGRFATGTVELKSNTTFYIDNGATIVGTQDISQYKGSKLRPEDPQQPIHINTKDIFAWTSALILIDNVQNVSITGNGTIDGESVPKPGRHIHAIMVAGSNKVNISNITVTRAGNWSIVGLYIEDFKLTNVTVTDGYDGIHIRQGKNILIRNCKLYCRDDAIAGGYWENTLITDCQLNSACNGIRLVLPATNLEIRYCEIIGPGVFGHYRGPANNPWVTSTLTGIILQPGAWGLGDGKLDKIYIHHIKIKDVQTALTFVLNEGNSAGKIVVENILATGISRNACSIEGWPEGSTFEDVKLRNISLSYRITDTALVKVKNFDRPRTESRPLPYWGFYVRNVNRIVFENVRLDFEGAEKRPAICFENVKKVLLSNVKYKKINGVHPLKYDSSTKVRLLNITSFN